MSTTEKIQMKLSDSVSARWTALFIVSVTMMFGYFFTDVISTSHNRPKRRETGYFRAQA